MKKVLGLDIGVSSIGMAIIKEIDGKQEIEKLAVRVIPEDPDFHGKFYSGNTASKNLARTEKRGSRRNNQRFKARRDKLYSALKKNNFFPDKELFQLTNLELYRLRALAASEKIELKELGRILILLNQRRGFLSNRKSNTEEENSTEYKAKMAQLENDLGADTIGQRLYDELKQAEHIHSIVLRERTYLRKSYLEEFDRIWDCQKQFYPELLTGGSNEDDNRGTLYHHIRNQILYYQRPLKSQKGLVSNCSFEKNHRAVSKSSPYFEIFRIWQKINDLEWKSHNGEKYTPNSEQKKQLFEALFHFKESNSKRILSVSNIKKILGYRRRNDRIYLNFPELDGSKTYPMLKGALEKAEVETPEKHLGFDIDKHDEKGGLLELWHITYSLPTEQEIISTLQKRFPFSEKQATIIAQNVSYKSDCGSLSTRAIRKLLPYMIQGMQYNVACDQIGYDHSGYKTQVKQQWSLPPIRQNSLRNPVVEQVLNQLVNMVNLAIDKYGLKKEDGYNSPFTQIRIELARELRNSAKTRKRISAQNASGKKENDTIRKRLKEEYHFSIVNGRDIKRYKLWEETEKKCLYCQNPINKNDFVKGNAELEHILPRSRSFSNAMSNMILAHRDCNAKKGQQTAYDFMESQGPEELGQYIEKVNLLYKDGAGPVSKTKFDNLLTKGTDIPADFVERMKKDTQFIAKEALNMLKPICPETYSTTGQVTDLLRSEWKLNEILRELVMNKYKECDMIGTREIKDGVEKTKTVPTILGWNKRDDHRHHAVDALICALTNQSIIFRLNNLNKIYQNERDAFTKEELEKFEKLNGGKFNLKEIVEQGAYEFTCPIENIRQQAKKHLEDVFISFKKNNGKVLSPRTNPANDQKCWTPRGRLHEETVMGMVTRQGAKPIKINTRFSQAEDITHPEVKKLVQNHLAQHNGDPKKAFSTKELKKNPIIYKNKEITEVKVFEQSNTKRVKLNENFTPAQLEKIIDPVIKQIVADRVVKYGSIKKALKNLSDDPLWFDQGKGIQIKSVKVYDESKVIATHTKRDNQGLEIIKNGQAIPTNYVKTGGNHHALIYKNEQGKYIDHVVSFWEAVAIGLDNVNRSGKPYPIIDRSDVAEKGQFVFSMQINDLFVFDLKHSSTLENENEIDFFDPNNRKMISDKLFRLQKMSKNTNGQFQITFRHHLETQVVRKDANGKGINETKLKGIAWMGISKNADLKRLTKVRLNHLGEIINIGE